MSTILEGPNGEWVKIEKDTICRSSSPTVCAKENPEILKLITHELWHQGWKVKESDEGQRVG